MASKECAKPKGKKRKIGDEKRVFSGAMDNVQRDKYPCVHRHAVKMTSLSGSLYLCEQLFSRMKYTKSSARSALIDEHLPAVLRIATTHVAIDFDALVKAKQCEPSH